MRSHPTRPWLAAALLTITGLATAASTASAAKPKEILPDLAMRKITDVAVSPWREGGDQHPVEGRWAVRFSSTIDNRGKGALILHAHRKAVGQPCLPVDDPNNRCEVGSMVADQEIELSNGKTKLRKHVGRVFFEEMHYHWHLKHVERYALTSAGGTKTYAHDSKTGFCLGDRLHWTRKARPEIPSLTDGLTTCLFGHADPATDGRRALELTMGISPGWSDNYNSMEGDHFLEGQQLEVTNLRAGRYQVVNRIDPLKMKLADTHPSNDAASTLIELAWPDGRTAQPTIKVIKSCKATRVCRKTSNKKHSRKHTSRRS